MTGFDQEVVVDPGMLKVMDQGCYVGGQESEAVGTLALQHASMHHEHVGHLEDRSHMCTAARQTNCRSDLLYVPRLHAVQIVNAAGASQHL